MQCVSHIAAQLKVSLQVLNERGLNAGYELFQDQRTTDRGIPSFQGRPLDTDPGAFFGSPDANRSQQARWLMLPRGLGRLRDRHGEDAGP